MNDWEIEKFLKAILAFQLAIWGVIALDTIKFEIPILRQVIGFIYLTFIPGIIILRILKLHKLGNVETLLYTVGLSIATLMFTGLFMNSIYPFIGIPKPISISSLIITTTIFVLILCIMSYVRDRDFSDPSYININEILSPPTLFLCLLPFLSIVGTYLVNFHHNNILLLFLIALIAFIVALITFDRFIPKKLYPFAVFILAIALLYHKSLITMYLFGSDIHGEYHLANLVMENFQWDPSIPHTVNAMLSIVMLAPIYSYILNMDLIWVFKIVYPLLFSLVPLALFQAYKKQTDDKTAFLSSFFFMSLFVFFGAMLQLARQQIAELFFALLILLSIDKKMNVLVRAMLCILFGISLVVSHYGLSYIYMFYLIFAWFLVSLMATSAAKDLKENLHRKFDKSRRKLKIIQKKSERIKLSTFNTNFVLLYVVFTISWYISVSASSPFNSLVHIGDQIYSGLYTDFLNPEARTSATMLAIGYGSPGNPAIQYEIYRIIQYITQFFIIIGVINLMTKRQKMKFYPEYVVMVLASTAVLLMCIVIPHFASKLYVSRFYHIALFFLAPFCVLGGITVFELISKALSRLISLNAKNKSIYLKLVVLTVLIPYFLFTTGFIIKITGETPASISLSLGEVDGDYSNEQEIYGAKWLSAMSDNHFRIYADHYGIYSLIDACWGRIATLPNDTTRIYKNSYIYLRSRNVKTNKILIARYEIAETVYDYIDLNEDLEYFTMINSRNKIYKNGGAQIYK
jgi:uncharacterized membrane protein